AEAAAMTGPDEAVLRVLRQALDQDPQNGPLWIHYADLLAQSGAPGEASAALRAAAERLDNPRPALKRLVPLLRTTGQLSEALFRPHVLLHPQHEPAP